jgi:thioesterase domain-containing protein
MDFRVLSASSDEVVLEAPLAPNINHRATAFGGSISALAILAGWAMAHFRLRDEGLEVRTVIRDGAIRYDEPVRGAFQARCPAPPAEAWDRMVQTLRRRGKARIRLEVQLSAGDLSVGSYTGTYVALERAAADADGSGPNPPPE